VLLIQLEAARVQHNVNAGLLFKMPLSDYAIINNTKQEIMVSKTHFRNHSKPSDAEFNGILLAVFVKAISFLLKSRGLEVLYDHQKRDICNQNRIIITSSTLDKHIYLNSDFMMIAGF